jgi:short-subunit dehydrogenase
MARRTIAGRCSLVTGASGGIGRAIAEELARSESHVVLVARRQPLLAEVADGIRAAGGRAETVVGSIADPQVRQRALEQCRLAGGGLDLLVNNAGVGALGRFADASPQRLREVFEINFFAAVELTREALPLLTDSAAAGRQPLVVNVGSILGHRATPRNSEYCASKFALRGFSESIRPELARLGIGLLLVSPGSTASGFYDHLIDKQGEVPWAEGWAVSPKQVARAAVRAMRRDRREIIPSFSGRMLVWLNRLAPWLVDRVMRRYG